MSRNTLTFGACLTILVGLATGCQSSSDSASDKRSDVQFPQTQHVPTAAQLPHVSPPPVKPLTVPK